jgi:transmembrane 9 superfamily protein 2/4
LSHKSSFDFCTNKEEKSPSENLGQVVFGERIRPSPYKLSFLSDTQCKLACNKDYDKTRDGDLKKLRLIKRAILLNYQQHWIIDNLPVVWCYYTEDNRKFCSRGFPIGCYVNKFGVQKDVCKLFVRIYFSKFLGSYFTRHFLPRLKLCLKS